MNDDAVCSCGTCGRGFPTVNKLRKHELKEKHRPKVEYTPLAEDAARLDGVPFVQYRIVGRNYGPPAEVPVPPPARME